MFLFDLLGAVDWWTVAAIAAGGGVLAAVAWVGARWMRGRDPRTVALNGAAWLVAGIAGLLAARGQVEFAEWAGVDDWQAYLVPAILEPSVVVLLLLANRRAQRLADGEPARSPRPLLALAGTLGGFAVYTNAVHAGRGGLVFGAATVVGLILWWVKLRDDSAPADVDAPVKARMSKRTARYRWLRWLFFPRQTHRAWRIALGYSVDDAERGLWLARRWRVELDRARLGVPPWRVEWWQARRAADEAVRVAVDQADKPADPAPAPAPVEPVEVRPVVPRQTRKPATKRAAAKAPKAARPVDLMRAEYERITGEGGVPAPADLARVVREATGKEVGGMAARYLATWQAPDVIAEAEKVAAGGGQ